MTNQDRVLQLLNVMGGWWFTGEPETMAVDMAENIGYYGYKCAVRDHVVATSTEDYLIQVDCIKKPYTRRGIVNIQMVKK